MNGLQGIAQSLAEQGRNSDTMLVHMAPEEVAGMQRLATASGTSLTTNPTTGLPEAFSLKAMLPTLLGAAASFIAPGVSPWLLGAGVGAIEGIRKKDLGAGIMAGLGAAGGAGIGSALSNMGTAQAAHQAGLNAVGGQEVFGSGLMTPDQTAAYAKAFNSTQAPTSFMGQAQAAGQGLQGLAQPGGPTAFMRGIDQAFPSTLQKTAALSGVASPMMAPEPMQLPNQDPYANYKGPYMPTPRTYRPKPGDDSTEWNYFTPSNPVPFREGGAVPMLEDGGFVLTKRAVDGMGGGSNQRGQNRLRQGLGAIPIRGPGTGTSDSIPTTIAGKVPAKVSNGEAYVPRDKVQKAGGSKNLYALMRKAERRG